MSKKKITLLLIPALLLFFIFYTPYLMDKKINTYVLSPPYKVSEAAEKLHKTLTIIDLHSDVLIQPRNILKESKVGHVDVPRLIKGNVAIQAFTTVSRVNIASDMHHTPSDALNVMPAKFFSQLWPSKTWGSLFEATQYQASLFDKQVSASQEKIWPIKSKQDLEQYLQLRKTQPSITAGFLGIEGLHALEGDIENLDRFYASGFRMMAPVHFFDNRLGGSAHGEQKGGLSPFGIKVIKKMESLNITLDLAHASEALIDDALKITSKAILVSHTGVKGTCDNARNLSDAHLKGIAATGGVIGIALFPLAICSADLNSVVKAIRYTTDLVGVDHVGLGSDFDGMVNTVFDSSGFILLTDALLKDGYSEQEIKKIMGENTLRVLRSNLPN